MKLAVENWPRWFRYVWPDAARRWRAMQGYRTLAVHHPETLADIAYRNNVFSPLPQGLTHDDVLIAEGRRQCAVEICKLAGMNFEMLWEQIEKRQKQENRT